MALAQVARIGGRAHALAHCHWLCCSMSYGVRAWMLDASLRARPMPPLALSSRCVLAISNGGSREEFTGALGGCATEYTVYTASQWPHQCCCVCCPRPSRLEFSHSHTPTCFQLGRPGGQPKQKARRCSTRSTHTFGSLFNRQREARWKLSLSSIVRRSSAARIRAAVRCFGRSSR
jgi:hypothetical protein